MKKFLALVLILSISLLSLTACSNDTETQQLTIDDIIEQSDGCVIVSTIGYKERMTQDVDTYYTQVILKQNNLNKPPEGDPTGLITIIQEGENYIKQEEKYIIFVNQSKTNENHFYVTGGKSGVIKLKEDFNIERNEPEKTRIKYKCLDKNMQDDIDKLWGEHFDMDAFLYWLVDTGNGYIYYGSELIRGVSKYTKPFYYNGTTAEPRTYSDENVITTAPGAQS